MTKVGFVMSPIDEMIVAKDSTLALMLAAQDKSWQLDYIQPQDLLVEEGIVKALAAEVRVKDDPDKWYELGKSVKKNLSDYDLIMMRIDPPFNSKYLYATQILDQLSDRLIVNSPKAIRDFNEKIFATKFPKFMPKHLLSSKIEELKSFHQGNEASVFKPLDAMGGKGLFMIKGADLNLNTILENLSDGGTRLVMAQEYIPEIIAGGDKRVLLFNGKAYPKALVRLPQDGDFRANLAAGGNYIIADITPKEQEICEELGPFMMAHGLSFVGLDIIGGYLSEINITCPTCLRQIAALSEEDPARFFLDSLKID